MSTQCDMQWSYRIAKIVQCVSGLTPDSDHQLIRRDLHAWTVFWLTWSLHSVHCSPTLPWAGDIRWSCWKLRSEDKETLGYLQQASLLRTHCVAAVKSLKAMIYFSSGFLKSCQCASALAPILIKLTYLWFSNDPEDISYVMWNGKICIN